MNRSWWSFAALFGVLALLFSALTPAYVAKYRIPFVSAVGIYVCFVSMLAMALAPGLGASRDWIGRRLPRVALPAVLTGLWCAPYVVYAAGTGDLRWEALFRLAAVGGAVPLIYRLFPVRDVSRFQWQDFAAAVWLIASLLSHQLNRIWNVPVNLDFLGRLFLIIVGSWTWIYVRAIPGLGYEFVPGTKTLRAAGLNFLYFAIVALPGGLALHFIAWHPRWTSVWAFCTSYVEIFLFIALLEELFFRGFLQTLLARNLKSDRAALIVVSCLFGLFHVLHAPFPNWRYVALATIAGWFYGRAFLEGGGVLASALVHAMVDTVWRTCFTR